VGRLPRIALALPAAAVLAVAGVTTGDDDVAPSLLRSQGPLRWAPPALVDPLVVAVEDGRRSITLDAGRDYVLDLPDHRREDGLLVKGGRNVVIVGGHVTVPADADEDWERKALSFSGQTGTIHVEGVLIDAAGEGDGISVSAPDAILQLENLRIVGLRGSEDGTHADVVQPWGGVRELRIDRLTGSSHYQGLQLAQDRGAIGRAQLSHVDLTALPGDGGGHMLWLTLRDCDSYPVRLRDVWVRTRPSRSFRTAVWPEARGGVRCGGRERRRTVAWPRLRVDGAVRSGRPPGGSFVPPGVAGPGYVSPGYDAPDSARLADASVHHQSLRGTGVGITRR
jgi:hypothetical protein